MYYNIFVFFILGLLSKFYDDYVDINEIKNILFPYIEYIKSFLIVFHILACFIDYNFIIMSFITFIICYYYGDMYDAFWVSYIFINLLIGVIQYNSFEININSLFFILFMIITILIDVSFFNVEFSLKKYIWRFSWIVSKILLCFLGQINTAYYSPFIIYYLFYAIGYATSFLVDLFLLNKINIFNVNEQNFVLKKETEHKNKKETEHKNKKETEHKNKKETEHKNKKETEINSQLAK
jgi:hypothetical protein